MPRLYDSTYWSANAAGRFPTSVAGVSDARAYHARLFFQRQFGRVALRFGWLLSRPGFGHNSTTRLRAVVWALAAADDDEGAICLI